MHLLLVAGTRPEVIKLRPVAEALRAHHGHVTVTWAFVGQQPDLIEAMITPEDIRGNLFIPVPRQDGTLVELHRALGNLAAQVPLNRYETVVVQGDTQTALVFAQAAALQGVPVAHVEAGLRTHRPWPFPEELNRKLITQLASLHLAPTTGAQANLVLERIDPARIQVTGNTSIDRMHQLLADKAAISAADTRLFAGVPEDAKRILVTCHRRENSGAQLDELAGMLQRLPYNFIWPAHPNYKLRRYELPCVDPVSHVELLALIQGSDLVITDSGGIIEEATELEKPCLILRNETERPEALDEACALVPRERMESLPRLIESYIGRVRHSSGRFGDGHAGEAIARALLSITPS